MLQAIIWPIHVQSKEIEDQTKTNWRASHSLAGCWVFEQLQKKIVVLGTEQIGRVCFHPRHTCGAKLPGHGVKPGWLRM